MVKKTKKKSKSKKTKKPLTEKYKLNLPPLPEDAVSYTITVNPFNSFDELNTANVSTENTNPPTDLYVSDALLVNETELKDIEVLPPRDSVYIGPVNPEKNKHNKFLCWISQNQNLLEILAVVGLLVLFSTIYFLK